MGAENLASCNVMAKAHMSWILAHSCHLVNAQSFSSCVLLVTVPAQSSSVAEKVSYETILLDSGTIL